MDSNIHNRTLIFNQLPTFSRFFYTVIACMFMAFVVPSCKKDETKTDTTGRTTSLGLTTSPGSSVSGNVTIEENKDKSWNVKIELSNTTKDSIIHLDIHNGKFVDPFERQAVDLGTIVGTGGAASKTFLKIKQLTLVDLSRVAIPYDSILKFKGFINISAVEKPHNTSTALAHVMLGQ